MNDGHESKAPGYPGGHALVVGVANYIGAKPLPATILNDARAVAEILTSTDYCGYDPRNVTTLLDGEATLSALRRELDLLAKRVGPEDTAIMFFSGHGGLLGDPAAPTSALIPFDYAPRDPMSTSFDEAEFSAALARIRAQRLVVLIDACHSGGAGTLKGPDIDFACGYTEKALSRLATGTGRVIIASSRVDEFSLVFNGAQNSLFTQHLVDALRGAAHTQGDGVIRILDVFNYVGPKVRNDSNDSQHPILKASQLEDNFPIALDRGGAKSTPPVSHPPTDAWKRIEDIVVNLYPTGPLDQEIWARAGGDVSRLRLTGQGGVDWFAALRTLSKGGGGARISANTLIRAGLDDFPHHQDLQDLLRVL